VLKALLDTNQLVSSLLSTQGPQAQRIDAWRQRAFVLGMVLGQVEEVAEVLGRPKIARKYRILAADRQALLQLLRSEAILLPVGPAPGVCRDPDDDYLLGSAAAGGMEYLVTGDHDLLSVGQYREVAIVDARHFLAVLAA
jgi:putative PIN family toxin of toxin-antitoxin system